MKLAQLVDAAFALDQEIKEKQARLKELKAQIIEKGPGDYLGDVGKATVIMPQAKISLDPEAVEAVQQHTGDAFGKLFERVVSYKPVKAFREIAAALLSKPKAKALLTLTEVQGEAYVKLTAAG